MDIKQLWEGELVSKSKPSHLDGGIDRWWWKESGSRWHRWAAGLNFGRDALSLGFLFCEMITFLMTLDRQTWVHYYFQSNHPKEHPLRRKVCRNALRWQFYCQGWGSPVLWLCVHLRTWSYHSSSLYLRMTPWFSLWPFSMSLNGPMQVARWGETPHGGLHFPPVRLKRHNLWEQNSWLSSVSPMVLQVVRVLSFRTQNLFQLFHAEKDLLTGRIFGSEC